MRDGATPSEFFLPPIVRSSQEICLGPCDRFLSVRAYCAWDRPGQAPPPSTSTTTDRILLSSTRLLTFDVVRMFEWKCSSGIDLQDQRTCYGVCCTPYSAMDVRSKGRRKTGMLFAYAPSPSSCSCRSKDECRHPECQSCVRQATEYIRTIKVHVRPLNDMNRHDLRSNT